MGRFFGGEKIHGEESQIGFGKVPLEIKYS